MSLRNLIRRTHMLIQHGLHVTRASATSGGFQRPLELTRLEDRVLFSASAIAPVVAEMADAATAAASASVTTSENSGLFPIADQQLLDLVADSLLPVQAENQSTSESAAADEHTLELVFLDSSISNLDQMMADLQADSVGDPSRTLEFVVLDSLKDGVAQITSALLQFNGVDGLHIVSHGEAGRVQLGSTTLSLDTLDRYRGAISAWQYSMSAKADILFYGCDLAASVEGQQLLLEISDLTGTDAAASEDLTGAAALGGDWDLEYQVGAIETATAAGAITQADWQGVLDITTGLKGLWTLDANANDTSGNAYNGTLTNGASIDTTSGTNKVGVGKLSLDGVNDYVDLSAHRTNFTSLTQGTVSAWIKTSDTDATILNLSDIADADSYASFYLYQGKLAFTVSENNAYLLDVVTTTAVNNNVWHQVAVTVDATGNNLYIDGVLQTSLTYYTGTAATQRFFSNVTGIDQMAIGADRNNSGLRGMFAGLIDDVRVYSQALTAADIGELATTAPTISGLAGDSLNYTVGAGALVVEQGTNVSITDIDSADFNAGTLTVSFAAGSDSAEDVLAIRSQGTGAGQIGVSGANVTFAGTTIGTWTGGSAGSNLVITFNANATPTNTAALLQNITFQDTDGSSPTTGTRTVRFVMTDGDGSTSSNYDAAVTLGPVSSSAGMWLSSSTNATSTSGVSWTDGTVVKFADPNLTFEPGTTAGTFSTVFDLDTFASDGNATLRGLYVVRSSIMVGGGANTVALQAGDVLFSTEDNETFGGIGGLKKDLWLFRPTTPGTYSTGTFSILLNSPSGDDMRDITLVESTVTVGGVTLNPGDFLISQSSATYDKDVWRFVATGVGNGTTAGTLTEFIDGADIGIGQQIGGMEFINQTVTLGNTTLTAGQFVMAVQGNDTVGDNSLSVTKFDLFILDVTQAGSTSAATATLLFQGADVGLTAGGEECDALTLIDVNQAPVLSGANNLTAILEDPSTNPGTLVADLISGKVTDSNSNALSGIAVTTVDNTNGTWQYSANGGTSWTAFGTPSAASSRLLIADTNSYVRFVPNANWNGTVSSGITFRAWDLTSGTAELTASTSTNGGNTAFSIATAAASITVTAVNDASTATNLSAAETYTEDAALNLTDIVVSDVDIASVTVTLTLSNTAAGSLNTGTSGAVTSTYVAGTGVWTASGAIADVNTLLAALTYTPALNFSSSFTIATSVTDGVAAAVTGTKTMTGTAVNDAPTATNLSAAETYTEDTALNLTDIVVSDVDSASATVTLTLSNIAAGSLNTGTSGAVTSTYVAGTGVWTASGAIADVNTLLAALTFTPASNFNSNFTIATSVSDGVAAAVTGTKSITATAINDAPVVNVPVSQSVNEDGTVTFSSGNGNQISVSDADAGSSSLLLSLSMTNGTLTLNGTTGLSLVSGGSGTSAMQYTGTLTSIDNALNGMFYTPTANFNGGAAMGISIGDQGNTGSGGALSDSKGLGVTVIPVNDAPTATNLSAAETYTEDTALNLTDIVVSDFDSASVTVTLTLSNTAAGSLNTGTSGAVTSTYVAGTGVWTASGVIADVNTLLAALTFTPASNFNSNFTIATSVSDGVAAAVTGTKSMTGTSVNDVPVNSVPAGQSMNEDATLVFSAANGNGLSIADIDAGVGSVQVTIIVTNGTLSLSTTSGLSFVSGDGTNDALMTFTGTLTAINASLDGLVLGPDADFNGAAVLQITSNDQGSNGSGGALSDTDSVNVSVSAVNDAPTISVPGPHSTPQNTPHVFSALDGHAISIADIDAGANPVQLTLAATNGTLTLAGTTGLSFSAGDGTDDATITFTGTIADINVAMDGLTFMPTTNFNGAASISVTADDQGNSGSGGPLSANASVAITISSNSPPVLNTSGGAAVFTEHAGAVAVDPGLTVSDSDNPTLECATIRVIANYINGEDQLLFADQSGITGSWNAATGTLVLSGTADVADYLVALRSVTYDNSSDNPATRTISFVVNDGVADSGIASRNMTIAAVNDPPVNSVPVTQTTTEDTSLVFSLANGNAIGVTDPDALSSPLQVTLGVSHGTLTLSQTTGLSFTSGTGSANAGMTFSGTMSAINAALNGLRFDPAADFEGTATLSLSTDDLGNSGTGGALTDDDTVDVTVNPVNDAPAIVNGATVTLASTDEDTISSGTLVSSLLTSATWADVDAGALSGIAVTSVSGNGPWQYSTDGNTWVSFGAVSTSNALLISSTTQVRYVPDAINGDTATFGFSAWDQTSGTASTNAVPSYADPGAGGGATSTSVQSATAAMTVTAVNDEQSITVNTGFITAEDSLGTVIASAMLTTSDLDNTPGQLIYTLTAATANGTLFRNGVVVGLADTFTQADVNTGLVTYDHNGSETGSDSFSFSVDDGAGAASSGTFAMTITPVNDNSPVITSNGGTATVSLNVAENSTSVTAVTATDADLPAQTLTFSIAGGADSGLFSINGTGQLVFLSGRDSESSTDADSNGIYEVIVRASDGTLFDDQAISVAIDDADEFDVTPPVDTNATANSVNENAAVGTVVGVTASAADSDATTNTVTYSLTDNAGGRFAVDSSTGIVTVAGAIDREAAASYDITVRSTSTDGSTADSTFTIAVNDVDEFDVTAPVDTNAIANLVNENAAVGTVVGVTATAADSDATTNTVTYSLTDNAGGRFAIDSSTGIVTAAGAIDREAAASYEITVRSTSTDGSTADSAFTIAVNDVDEFDVTAVMDTNGLANSVGENAGNGTLVGITASASDADATTNLISYTLDDNAGGRFAIHSGTGVVSVADGSLLDYESAITHSITVRATSTDGSVSSQSYSISILPLNDNTPLIGSDGGGTNAAVSVAENSTLVTIVAATDADSPSQSVSYSIIGGADAAQFSLDSAAGTLSFNSSRDFETPTDSNVDNTYEVIVAANDGAGGSDSQIILVTVTNVNEAPLAVIIPVSYSVNEQTSLILHGTGLSIADVDAAGANLVATISVVAGTLNAVPGSTGVSVSGDGTNTVSLTGTVAQINDLLAGNLSALLTYVQNSDTPVASDPLTLLVNDLGNSGSGGALIGSDSATIFITALNDAPTLSVPGSQTISVDNVLTFGGANAIVVGDPDSGTVQVTLSASNGGLTLTQTTGLTFGTGNGSDDASTTFTGAISDVNAALDGLKFMHGINHGGSAVITIDMSDLGNTGIGGVLTTSASISVTVTTPGGAAVPGDAFLQGNYLQLGLGTDGSLGSDFAAPTGYVSAGAKLGVEADRDRDGWSTYDGDFILPGSPEEGWGVTVGGVTYSNNNVMVLQISGSLTNLQTSATSQSVDWSGSVGGIDVIATYSVGVNDLFVDVEVTLTNTTAGTLNDLYYYRNIDADNNYDANGVFATTNTIVSQGNDGSEVSFVTATQADGSFVGLMGFGTDSRVSWGGFSNRDAVAIFNGTGLNQSGFGTGDRAISLSFHVASLAAADSTTVQYRYYFCQTDAPVIDLDADNSGGVGGSDFVTNYSEGMAAVAIVDTDAALADIDSASLTGMTVTITNLQDGVAESLSANTAGTGVSASYNATTGELTLSGTDTIGNYRQVLRTITWQNNSENPDSTVRHISFTAGDGSSTSKTAYAYVIVTPVNDAPVVATNAAGTVIEGGTSVITAAELHSTDVDNIPAQLRYTVTSVPVHGFLEFSTTPGAGITEFTQADIDAGLVRYVHDGSNTTADSFTFKVTDGALSVSTFVHNYILLPLNDAPVIVANSLTISESGTVVLTNSDLQTSDPDSSAAQLAYTVSSVTGGRFEFVTGSGITISSFTQDDVNNGLVQFVHDGNEIAPTYNIAVSDGALNDGTYAATINFSNVNDTPVIADAAFSLPENSANGTSVGTVALTDPDPVDSHAFSIIGGNTGNTFAINSTTGDITVNDPSQLDFETAPVFTLTVRVQDLAGTFDTATITINLTNIDEYDTTAIVDTNSTLDSIAENSAAGTTVGIVAFADDLDQPDNISYSLDDDAGGRFAIDAVTGVVTAAAAIDRELTSSWNITVRATSTDTSTATRVFTISVNDVNEFGITPILDTDATPDAVIENASVGTVVGITAFASDADATTNGVTYSLDNNAGGRFTIDAVTGIVTVANGALLDREAAVFHTIVVRAASDDGSFSTLSVDISLIDVNEFGISPAVDIDATANLVAELALQGTLTGITVSAVDADATNGEISYVLDDSAAGRFQIDALTGVITVGATPLDYETATTCTITARATSADGSTATIVLTVNLTDVNEASISGVTDINPVIDAVLENAISGTTVGISAFASDADGSDVVSYSLDDSAGGRFAIDAGTGIVTVAGALDRETAGSHTMIVRATSTDGSSATQSYTIQLIDVNEFAIGPIADINAAANSVSENAANGTMVGITAAAVDGDATGSSVTYSLDDSSSGRFIIDSVTGIVTAADGSLLDYELAASHNIVVRATSLDGSASVRSFAITLVDTNDSRPVILPNQQFSVSELSSIGTTVGNVVAADADGVGALLGWTITSGNADGVFSINASTGQILVANVTLLNFESISSYTLTLAVSDGVSASAPQTVRIIVLDQNETPAFIAAPVLSVNENSLNGVLAGSVAASDPDSGDSLTYAILSSGPVSPFAIDGMTGQIRVIDSSLLNFEAVSSITLSIEVTDAGGLVDTQVITISINDLNEAPTDLTFSGGVVAENSVGGSIVATVSGSDPDAGDNLNYTLVNSSSGRFVIDAATGIVGVAPGASLDFEASPAHVLTLWATDSSGLFHEESFTVTIANVNEAPQAVADHYMTLQLSSLSVSAVNGLVANDFDEDGDSVSAVLVSGPAHGTLTLLPDGSLNYQPSSVFSGVDFFTYQLTDGTLFSSDVTVTIDVRLSIGTGSTGNSSGGNSTNGNSSTSGSTGTSSGGSSETSTGNASEDTGAASHAETTLSGAGPLSGQNMSSVINSRVTDMGVDPETSLTEEPEALQLTSMILATLGMNDTDSIDEQNYDSGKSVGKAERIFATLWQGSSLFDSPHNAMVPYLFFSIDNRDGAFPQGNSPFGDTTADKLVIGTTAVVTSSLSVGYVIWLLRGGSLLTAFMSALPAWQSFDPLLILQSHEKEHEEDDESLLGIATRKTVARLLNKG